MDFSNVFGIGFRLGSCVFGLGLDVLGFDNGPSSISGIRV